MAKAGPKGGVKKSIQKRTGRSMKAGTKKIASKKR